MKSVRKMLQFHEPAYKTSDPHSKIGTAEKFVTIADIHRIDAVPEWSPVYKDGSRSIIVCKGKDGKAYHATETPAELVARIEGDAAG